MQRLAYIRATSALSEKRQKSAIAPYAPDLTWRADAHSLDDVIQMMSKPGRELVVAGFGSIATRVADRNRVIDEVLSSGSVIIDALTDTRLQPECRATILVLLGMRRRDRAEKSDIERGYTVAELEACLPYWQNANLTTQQIGERAGISYTTLWRYFSKDRAVAVPSPRRAGRPSNDA